MEPTATDSELVRQVRAGNAQGFTPLVQRHFGLVYAVAYAQTGHRETAEDLAQEVFLRAYLYLASLQDPSRFSSWLVQITHNLAKDWRRRNTRVSRLATMVPIDDAEMEAAMAEQSRMSAAMASQENAEWLNKAILKLPEVQREAVLLHYAEGLSQKEIADRLAVHPSTIGRHLKLALGTLHRSLEPILKNSAHSLKARGSSVARAVVVLGAAAAMSAQSKSALAAAGGGAAWIASVSAPVPTAGPIAGILIPFSTALFSGGKIMVLSKMAAVAVVGISLAVGGSTLFEHRKAGAQFTEQAKAAEALPTKNPTAATTPSPGIMPGGMMPGMAAPGMLAPPGMMPPMETTPTPSPTPTPKHYPALKGQRVYDAVSYRQKKEGAIVLDDVRRIDIPEDKVAEYSDDGKTLGDRDVDGVYSQILPDSRNEYVGPRSSHYRSRLLGMLQHGQSLAPLDFFGGAVMTCDRNSLVPNTRERLAQKNKKMLSGERGSNSGFAENFVEDYRIDPKDNASKFLPLYVPQAPQPPSIAPPPQPWKPMNHRDIAAMKKDTGAGTAAGMGAAAMSGMMPGMMASGGMVDLPAATKAKVRR